MSREEKLKQFKKSNKERREKLAKKEGFSTVEDYMKFLSRGTKTKIKVTKEKKSKSKDMLDYVVAFDTTGSMSSYIDNVKKHVKELIPTMFDQDIDLKMKIVAFGDYCDMESSTKFGRAFQESEFTSNTNDLIKFVNDAKGTDGGDSDEFYELVIKKIVEETPWRTGARKAVLFIADCNPHPVGYSYSKGWNHENIVKNAQIDWKKEAKKAKELEIGFDTLSIHGDSYKWYKQLSEITGGVYMPFKSSNKTAEVVAASAYVRGSKKSKGVFYAAMSAAVDSGDTELIGTYKTLSTLDTE